MERKISKVMTGKLGSDGAGVKLVRVLDKETAVECDPFLLLDSFDSRNYDDYREGFPVHPHRGIETITYISSGSVIHEDTLGNKKKVGDKQIQWMSSGSGIEHSEYFEEVDLLRGAQIWLNIPAKEKMSTPTYREVTRDEVISIDYKGANIDLYAGSFEDKKGVQGGHLPLDLYSIKINPGEKIAFPAKEGNTLLLFSLQGDYKVAGQELLEKACVKTTDGDSVEIEAVSEENELLWLSAPPLKELIAWGGPIVMSTAEDLLEAFKELRDDTFIKENFK